ncbi:uncharacterized protein BJ212DRAFT_1303850 [Suillus subaureus]|uniref:Uncharacterized protein n=1 Tax=Suillus subaureus TaxID=48587 RepID=A0A9P7J729_9AGAM|nr:uncharacterized protein BJ212DRAFT_1303850 [Suillus subaureus]KAG1805999.1 hypothetical protein BJ212DRAFT_1303850 [Suillus subaureus]
MLVQAGDASAKDHRATTLLSLIKKSKKNIGSEVQDDKAGQYYIQDGVVLSPAQWPEKAILSMKLQMWWATQEHPKIVQQLANLFYQDSHQFGLSPAKKFVNHCLTSKATTAESITQMELSMAICWADHQLLMISHGGGKAKNVLANSVGAAQFQQAKDQEVTDKSVHALLKNYKNSGVVHWKFAFWWCKGQGDLWWTTYKYKGFNAIRAFPLQTVYLVHLNELAIPVHWDVEHAWYHQYCLCDGKKGG